MATEIVTNYPLPPWFDRPDFGEGTRLAGIERRLGTIEDQLSRIEREITKQQTKE